MSLYEEFRLRILERAASANPPNPYVQVTARGLANKHGIPRIHIQSDLLCLAEFGFMSLSVWDGERERPYDAWPDANSFFSNTSDNRRVRIRLLSKGQELLSKDMPLLCDERQLSGGVSI
jgi:hypothetical protein